MVVSVNNLVIYIAYSNLLLLHNNIVQEKKITLPVQSPPNWALKHMSRGATTMPTKILQSS
jgi:hypothetical protein